MKKVCAMMCTVCVLAGTGAFAQSGPDVVKAQGCLNCHAVDKTQIGPAFNAVAAKYKGNKDAPAMLVAKLKEGKGHMKVAATDAELNAAVQYVLSLR